LSLLFSLSLIIPKPKTKDFTAVTLKTLTTLLEKGSRKIIEKDGLLFVHVTQGIKRHRNHKGTMMLDRDMETQEITFEMKSDFNSTLIEKTRLTCHERFSCSL